MPERNTTYFDTHADTYADRITSIQRVFYENSARLLNRYLPPNGVVLDLGNGGVINYEYDKLLRLDCADIVISPGAEARYAHAGNIRFFQADATDMAGVAAESYDAVILQTVIHHLAGPTLRKTEQRVKAAIQECRRVLRPGGRLLVMESTVAPWFCSVERAFYPAMALFFRLCRFGYVYQFSPATLQAVLACAEGLRLLSSEKVDVGSRIWLMGHSVPTRLTPCGVCFYVLQKEPLRSSVAGRSPDVPFKSVSEIKNE